MRMLKRSIAKSFRTTPLTPALHLLGVIRQQQGRHAEACELIGRAIEADPGKAVYRNNYGAALLSLDRPDEAEASFRRALGIRPRYADAWANLGMARYFANGSLDTGFGVGGGATAGLTVATTDPCGLAIGSDGSIVAACTVQTGANEYAFGVVRLGADGTLDTSFNQSGEVTDDWGDSCNHATSVAIESDGSIVVGGYDASVSGDYVDLVRFLPDGSVDPNFLYGQLAYEPIAGVAYSVAIQPNNMILVGGAFAEAVGERMDFGVARLMDSGAVDQNFGTNGVSARIWAAGARARLRPWRSGRTAKSWPPASWAIFRQRSHGRGRRSLFRRRGGRRDRPRR